MSCSWRRRRLGCNLALTVAAEELFAGCETPNTPGTGYGAEYTPAIGLQGVDQGKCGE